MFLAGADGQTPELRAPSIKGAMRFWWRAVNGHLPLEDLKGEDGSHVWGLKSRENQLFGGTKNRSPFSISVSIEPTSLVNFFNYKEEESKRYVFSKELKYFQYTFFAHETGMLKKALNVGTTFHVTFQGRDRSILFEAAKLFKIVSFFGGLGTRSRRCSGAFSIQYDEVKSTIPLSELPFLNLSPVEMAEFVFKDTPKPERSSMIQWSHIGVQSSVYIHREGFKNWENGVEDIAHRMMKIRDGDTVVKNNGLQSSPFSLGTLNKKAAFGLPVQVRNETKDFVCLKFFNDSNSDDIEDKGRRASPFYISVIEYKRKFYWSVIHFSGQFMPDDSEIRFKERLWKSEDNELVGKFLESLNLASSSEDVFFDDELPSVTKITIS